MKILLTGATGFIGAHFLESLLKEHQVIVLIRDIKKTNFYMGRGIQFISGDCRDPGIVDKIPEGIDLLCHAAGILGKWGLKKDVYNDVQIRGTENLLRACLQKNIKRIIYISSAGVLGSSQAQPLDENSGYNPKSPYEQSKAEAEQRILKFAKENGLLATILRPEFVYGEGNLHILGFFKAIKERKFFLINKGQALVHPTYVGDVAQALNLVIRKQVPSNIYLIAGERVLSVRELANIMARLIGVASPIFSMPYIFAKTGAVLLEILGKAFHFQPIFTNSRLDFFTKNKAYCIGRAVSELGYQPIRLEEGLRRTIHWYKKNGYL